MILELERLGSREFTVSHIQFYCRRHPEYRRIRQKGRRVNGLVVLQQGECRFTFDGGGFTMQPGAVAYVPYGSRHTFELLTDDTTFFCVNFHVDLDGETVLFSDAPLLLCRRAPTPFTEALQTAQERNGFVDDSLARAELLCTMLRSLSAASAGSTRERLAPAAAYLVEHMTEKVSCAMLASLCNLSPSRFYRLFRQEYGMPPLAYRDELLIRRAKQLLQSDYNVGETADLLGFGSAAYFSRFFKKHRGISPSVYAAKQKGGI